VRIEALGRRARLAGRLRSAALGRALVVRQAQARHLVRRGLCVRARDDEGAQPRVCRPGGEARAAPGRGHDHERPALAAVARRGRLHAARVRRTAYRMGQ